MSVASRTTGLGLVSQIEFRNPVYQACVRFVLREYSTMNLEAAAIIELVSLVLVLNGWETRNWSAQ